MNLTFKKNLLMNKLYKNKKIQKLDLIIFIVNTILNFS